MAVSGIKSARAVAQERLITGGGIAIAVVVLKRLKAKSRIPGSGRIGHERVIAQGRVLGIIADFWTLRVSELTKAEDGAGNDKTRSDFHLDSPFA
jgi:hypothetical protein